MLQESEDTKDDADLNTESNNIYEENNSMIISMEEEKKTLEYQVTMRLDNANIPKN